MTKTLNVGSEDVPLSLLKPHPRNIRQGDFGAIQESVEANGFYGRVVANRRTNHILAGNHRYHVAKSLGFDTLPVEWVDVDADAELRILLADNRTNDLASNHEPALAALLAELSATDRGLAGTGYDGDALDELIASLAFNKPEPGGGGDDFDATPQDGETRVQTGELWRVGPHRLMCGDSTKVDDVGRLMVGEKSEMVWTDPPYGVSVGDKNKFLNSIARSNRVEENLENDTLPEPELVEMLRGAFANAAEHGTAGGAWYVAAPAGPLHILFGLILKEMGIYRQTLIWVKHNATFAPLGVDYHWRHEPIFYGWLPGAGHRSYGGRQQDTVWEIDRPQASPEHPTMKPLELVTRAIENSSQPGELVYDAFLGSGTTLIAAQRTGRRCYGCELSPAYCDVILARAEAEGIAPIERIEPCPALPT